MISLGIKRLVPFVRHDVQRTHDDIFDSGRTALRVDYDLSATERNTAVGTARRRG